MEERQWRENEREKCWTHQRLYGIAQTICISQHGALLDVAGGRAQALVGSEALAGRQVQWLTSEHSSQSLPARDIGTIQSLSGTLSLMAQEPGLHPRFRPVWTTVSL